MGGGHDFALPVFLSFMDMIFAGIQISSGRKPITYAVLDDGLNVVLLEKCDLQYVIADLEQHKNVIAGVNVGPGSKSANSPRMQQAHEETRKKIVQSGIKPYRSDNAPKQWVETNPTECFRALSGHTPQSRGTLGGLIQRALILYDEGLQIKDPMEFFEEITRHHLLAGIMPMELLYSAPELDALASAYLAWLLVNKPVQVDLTNGKGDGMIVIPREDKNWRRKNQ